MQIIKLHPPNVHKKVGKSSKTRTKAGKIGTQQPPHFPKILYHQRRSAEMTTSQKYQHENQIAKKQA